MEKETEKIIFAKIVISLNRLLSRLNENRKTDEKLKDIPYSYGKIGVHILMRKSTVANVFTGKSFPNSKTLISIIEAMGYNLSDFAAEYDSITDEEAKEFEMPKAKKKERKQ